MEARGLFKVRAPAQAHLRDPYGNAWSSHPALIGILSGLIGILSGLIPILSGLISQSGHQLTAIYREHASRFSLFYALGSHFGS
jgi:hypothetical protein